jgi:hypothetical protein
MPSFGVGRDNPILKSAIPASKSPYCLDFASGSRYPEILKSTISVTQSGMFWAMVVSGGFMLIHADPRGTP